jgi:hypothetical protein
MELAKRVEWAHFGGSEAVEEDWVGFAGSGVKRPG